MHHAYLIDTKIVRGQSSSKFRQSACKRNSSYLVLIRELFLPTCPKYLQKPPVIFLSVVYPVSCSGMLSYHYIIRQNLATF